MVSSPKIESLAQRFALYIDELHDFFSSRKVPFGTVADLQAFPALLRDPAFHEEMVSMVRSIVYRESEAVPRTELMDMLAIAVAGPGIEEAAPELHETFRQILTFVTEVVRSQRATLPELSVDDDRDAPAFEPAAAAAPLRLAIPQTPEDAPHPLERPAQDASLPTNDRLSRALIDSEAEVNASPAAEVSTVRTESDRRASIPETPRPFAAQRQSSRSEFQSPRRSFSAYLRHAYWIPGVCVLLLALAGAYFLHSHSQQQLAAVTKQTTPVLNPEVTKPSADIPEVGGPSTRERRPARQSDGIAPQTPIASASPAGARSSTENRLTSRSNTNAIFAGVGKRNELRPTISSSNIAPRVLGGREGVFLASSGMMAAHLLTAPAPHYPKLASLAHEEGEVIVQVVVARDGRVEATRVLDGPRLLRGAAEHAIRHWRYRPYLVDGKPTDVATIVTVNFRLSR